VVESGAEPRVVAYGEALQGANARMKLKAHALAAVVGLVPTTVAFFMPVTRRLELDGAIVLQTNRPDFSAAHEWARYLSKGQQIDPFVPQRVAASGSNVLTLRDIPGGRSPFVGYLAEMRMCDRAMVYLRSAGTIVAVIALLRSVELPEFSRADVLALRRLQPLVEHAYLCAEPKEQPLHGVCNGLTAREAEVAQLVGKGATNAEIAQALHVSPATVKTHLTRIYTKTGVRTRTQLAILVGGASSS
jgi:DNA-binding CsgD family transcriptional regulator